MPSKKTPRKQKDRMKDRERSQRVIDLLPSGAPGLHALLDYVGINFRFDYVYVFTCFGINFKSVIGNCFWDQFPGCKGICISPPLLLDVPPLGITLTLQRLHFHS